MTLSSFRLTFFLKDLRKMRNTVPPQNDPGLVYKGQQSLPWLGGQFQRDGLARVRCHPGRPGTWGYGIDRQENLMKGSLQREGNGVTPKRRRVFST